MPNIDHYCKTVLQYIFILRLPRICFNTRFHNTMSPGIKQKDNFGIRRQHFRADGTRTRKYMDEKEV